MFLKKILQRFLTPKISREDFFHEITNKKKQKRMASEYLSMVEVEVFSFCNRKCWFCPNSFIDRHSSNNFMPEKSYLKLLKELSTVDYNKTISYSRYNEPLSDKIILTRIAQARKFLPKSRLHTNTNGDYITKDYIEELSRAGLNSLNIQCYLDEKEEFSKELIKSKIAKLGKKINLTYEEILDTPSRYEVKFNYEKLEIHSYALNFKEMGTNRGASVDKIKSIDRQCPCFIPFGNLYVDYNGNVMPCCNLRSDNDNHKSFVLGNISSNTIFSIFTNSKIAKLRNHLSLQGKKIKPCDSCNFGF